MNKPEIKLPPLPEPDQYIWYSRESVEQIRKAAVELDRQGRGEPVKVPSKTEEYALRAMASNYTRYSHQWDRLDSEVCRKAADEIRDLRSLLARYGQPAQPAASVEPYKLQRPHIGEQCNDIWRRFKESHAWGDLSDFPKGQGFRYIIEPGVDFGSFVAELTQHIIKQVEQVNPPLYTAPVAAQPSVPAGLSEILREAAEIIAAVPTDYAPEILRGPIVDELEGFAGMLAAAPTPPADAPCEHSDHVRPADGVCVECGEVAQQDDIAKSIHYPDCWDTAAYPTLSSALHELHAWFRCSNDDCPTTPLPQQETCQTCQGNGEIVTDWERYREPHDGDKGDEAVAECPDCDGQGTVEQDAEKVDAPSPEWMTCESRRPWVTNSLEHHIKELRGAEKRSRNAFKKDYMGEPARYFADACGEAAALFESRLSAIAAAIQERQP